MNNKSTILVLTDSYDRELADIVIDELSRRPMTVGVIVTREELMKKDARFIYNWLQKPNTKLRRLFMNFWESKYYKDMDKVPKFKTKYNKNIVKQRYLCNAITRYNPNVIMVTTPKLLNEAVICAEKENSKGKVVAVNADIVMDKRMINPKAQNFIVDNYDMRQALVENFIDEKVIDIIPLAVKKDILKLSNRDDAIKKLGLDEHKRNIAVIPSRRGDESFIATVEYLSRAIPDANLIVACGNDQNLLISAKNAGAYAFNEGVNMRNVIDCADIVITRPTTNVLRQCMVKNKPTIGLFPKNLLEQKTLDYLSVENVLNGESIENTCKIINEYFEYLDAQKILTAPAVLKDGGSELLSEIVDKEEAEREKERLSAIANPFEGIKTLDSESIDTAKNLVDRLLELAKD